MVQIARPNATNSAGGWTAGGTLHGDTSDQSDSTYATGDSADTTMDVNLNSITDPVSSSGHVLRIRAQASGGGGGPERFDAGLYQNGSQVVFASGIVASRGSWTTHQYPLTAEQADSITNYGDLEVRVTINTLAAGETILVSNIEFEVPDAPTAENVSYLGLALGRMP